MANSPLIWVDGLIDAKASKAELDRRGQIDAVNRPHRQTNRPETSRPAQKAYAKTEVIISETDRGLYTPETAQEPGEFALVAMQGKATKDYYAGLTERLEYEAKKGSLIPVEEVRREGYEAALAVKNALFNIPARLAQPLALEQDAFEVHRILDIEIRAALAAALEVLDGLS